MRVRNPDDGYRSGLRLMTTLFLLLKGMLLNEGSAKEFAKELAVSSMIGVLTTASFVAEELLSD